MRPRNTIQIDDLEMLGHCDFDKLHDWTHNNITNELNPTTTSFIDLNCLSTQLHEDNLSLFNSLDSLSPSQRMAFDVVISHFRNTTPTQPLKMVIQGTAGTGKSYLISCLKYVLQPTYGQIASPLILLDPTSVVSFNIHALAIHYALKITIVEMHPLELQTLSNLQE